MTNFKNIFRLLNILKINKYYLSFIIFLFICSSLVDVLSIGLILPYVSTILNLENSIFNILQIEFFKNLDQKNLVIFLSVILIFIFLLKTVLSIFIRWMITRFAFTQYTNLQISLMNCYQNMNFEDYISRNSSEYIRNIRELSSDCSAAIEAFLRILSEFLIFSSIFIFLTLINYKIVIFLLIFFVPVLLVYEFLLKPINLRLGKVKTDLSKNAFKSIDSGINAFKEIKVLSKQNFFLSSIKSILKKSIGVELKSSLIKDSPRYVFEFVTITPPLIFIIYLFMKDSFNAIDYIPTISVFIFAALRILPSISIIVNALGKLSFATPAMNIVFNDLEKNNTSEKNNKNFQLSNHNEVDNFTDLSLENVDFKYRNSNNLIFKNLNINIKKEDCIGIMGESGAGKTTLIHILLGLIKPHSGVIKLNGKKFNLTDNMKIISAYLPQDPIILDDSIEKNISLELENSKINQERFSESIKKANLTQVINDLPLGEKTLIGENGVRLSGGQYRRIAIARTFYHRKKIIIMDEATNSLDKKTEKFVVDQIKELKGKTTVILISHDRDTLKHCDKVMMIKNKKIVEEM